MCVNSDGMSSHFLRGFKRTVGNLFEASKEYDYFIKINKCGLDQGIVVYLAPFMVLRFSHLSFIELGQIYQNFKPLRRGFPNDHEKEIPSSQKQTKKTKVFSKDKTQGSYYQDSGS